MKFLKLYFNANINFKVCLNEGLHMNCLKHILTFVNSGKFVFFIIWANKLNVAYQIKVYKNNIINLY